MYKERGKRRLGEVSIEDIVILMFGIVLDIE
jgi:hypothetical protein